ncbi:uncharacterized protein [Amphiura filiformis]|uniref:uncharacterized protein n=1 Tax=Amphiura filiformis TaxID=82378 RepID=UPI003B224AC3
MADAEGDFSAEGIREFIISRGGRVKNVELVGHYKKYLNDPAKKAENRQHFKDFINAVAVVKVENGKLTFIAKNEKTLVLKKKQQDWSSPKPTSPRDISPRQRRPGQAPPPPPPGGSPSPTPSPRRISPVPSPRTRPPTTPPPPPPNDASPSPPRPVPKPRSSKKTSPVPAKRIQISAPVHLQRQLSLDGTPIAEPVYAELSQGEEISETPKRGNGAVRNGGTDLGAWEDSDSPKFIYAGPGAEQKSFISPKEGERIIDAKSQISSVKNQASFFQEAVAKQTQEIEAMKSPMRTPKKPKSIADDPDGTLKGDEEMYATLAPPSTISQESSDEIHSITSVPQDLPEYRKIEKFLPEPEDRIDEVLEDLDQYLDQDLLEWETSLEESETDKQIDLQSESCEVSTPQPVPRSKKDPTLQTEGSVLSGSNKHPALESLSRIISGSGKGSTLQTEGSVVSGESDKHSTIALQSQSSLVSASDATLQSESSTVSGESDKHATLQSQASLASIASTGQDLTDSGRSTRHSSHTHLNDIGQLDPLEREWMMYASEGNTIGMHNLLVQDPTLCAKKDFITLC